MLNTRIILLFTAIFAAQPASADTPTRIVDSGQQAVRDHEKLNILQNELNEQRELASQLQQKRAIDLSNDNQDELAKTESRLEEVNGNITQIQQEIKLAQGQTGTIKPATIKLQPLKPTEPTKTAQREDEQPNSPTGQWWDLYNKRKK